KPITVCSIYRDIVTNIHLIKINSIKSNIKLIAIQKIHHHDTRRKTHFYLSHCVSTKFGIN
ncbi:hypothetical protein C0J52_22754, partial [Blattella germanica]